MQPPQIVYEDNHLIIVDKPSSWLVQGDKTNDFTLTHWLQNYIKEKYQKLGNVFVHPAHRLDRPVSGLVIFGKTSKVLARMQLLFHNNEIEKKYMAIVRGEVQGKKTLCHWLKKDKDKNITKAFASEVSGSKKAIIEFEPLKSKATETLISIKPLTGRSHQIRVQLATNQTPIKGDVKYGYPVPNNDKSICLQAHSLKFIHPVSKNEIKLEQPIPNTIYWDF